LILKDYIPNKSLISEYRHSEVKEIVPEHVFLGNSNSSQKLLLESYNLGVELSNTELITEFGLQDIKSFAKKVGKKALPAVLIAKKVTDPVTNSVKSINSFVKKQLYDERGKLKEFDKKTYESIKSKFDAALGKLPTKAQNQIRKQIKSLQQGMADNPIKTTILTVVMMALMSILLKGAGVGYIGYFTASLLFQTLMDVFKSDKPPIDALFDKLTTKVIYAGIGKLVGFLGGELWAWAKETLFSDSEIDVLDSVAATGVTSLKGEFNSNEITGIVSLVKREAGLDRFEAADLKNILKSGDTEKLKDFVSDIDMDEKEFGKIVDSVSEASEEVKNSIKAAKEVADEVPGDSVATIDVPKVDAEVSVAQWTEQMGFSHGQKFNYWELAKKWYADNTKLSDDSIDKLIKGKIEALDNGFLEGEESSIIGDETSHGGFPGIITDPKHGVTLDLETWDELGMDDNTMGVYYSDRNTFYLNPNIQQKPSEFLETLTHETFHGHQENGSTIFYTHDAAGNESFGQSWDDDHNIGINAAKDDVIRKILNKDEINKFLDTLPEEDVEVADNVMGRSWRYFQKNIHDTGDVSDMGDKMKVALKKMNISDESKAKLIQYWEDKIEQVENSQTWSSHFTNYINDPQELEVRLRTVQQAFVAEFGEDGIINPGDTEKAREAFNWFTDKDNIRTAEVFKTNPSLAKYAKELKHYVKSMPDEQKKELYNRMMTRITKLASTDIPKSPMMPDTMVAENYKLIAKQLFI
jgi:hypothetical protein